MSRHRSEGDRSSPLRDSHSGSSEDTASSEFRNSSDSTIRSSSSSAQTSGVQLPPNLTITSTTSAQTSRVVIPLELVIPDKGDNEDLRASPPPSKSPSPTPSAPGGGSGHSGSSHEVACRICQDTDPPLYVWCNCKGTIGMAHKECLEEWIARSGATRCELCGYTYHTQRVARFASRLRSVRPWLTGNVMEQTALVADALGALLCLSVGGGTAIVCGLGVSAVQDPRTPFSSPDALFLQLMCFMASMVALVWFLLAVRFHVCVWMRWWNQQYDVRVVPRSEESLRKEPGRAAALAETRRKGFSTPCESAPVHPAPAIRVARPPGPRRPLSRFWPWRWLRQQNALHAAARESIHDWHLPRRDSPARAQAPATAPAPLGARSPGGHVSGTSSPGDRGYNTIRGNRYYTMVDPFNDWTHGSIPYTMLSLPVSYQNVRESNLWRNQVSVPPTSSTAPIHSFRVPPSPTISNLSSSPSPPPPPTSPPPAPPSPPPDIRMGFGTETTEPPAYLQRMHTSSDSKRHEN